MVNVLLTAWWLAAPFVGAYGFYLFLRLTWRLLHAFLRGSPRP